ncbi:MAG: 6-phosphogluconolactonase [Candidatus Eisenbacteria bacterium RBG_16_71_46]|nr:MAG: 6-phosphogluconolactonase [Candidatus Eisenbacteria bacterium RBG_16_71_46]OGF23810.1 MAG: 6-phosphogluconolactonase [Candidatus Eisenbacteria bacterium RBG_19FT_COMBO_70_11]
MPAHVFEDADALAAAAAERVVAAAGEAIAARGRFDLGLSGGTTPAGLYRRLGGAWRERVDWGRVRVWFADERAVPPGDPQSAFRLARETLIDPAGVPARNVHRMKGEYPDLAVAVAEYEAHLVAPLDLLVLGVGPDGHTASLFPGSPLLAERSRRVGLVEDSPKPPPRRITVTPRVLDEARVVLVLATGPEKAAAVARALEGEAAPNEVPARLVRGRDWYIDRAAASGLRRAG